MLIIGSSRSGKTNALLNLIKQQDDDGYKILLTKFIYMWRIHNEAKYQCLINKPEKLVFKICKMQKFLLNI